MILDACSVEALKNGREAGIAVRFAEAVRNEGLVKGTPEFEELEKQYVGKVDANPKWWWFL